MNRKAFAYPYIVWMGIFIIVPIAMVVVCAFTTDFSSGDFTFTLANFDRLINSELNYVEVFVRSIKLALICTVICLAIGYPVSYIIADRKMKLPSLLIIMFIMPMWMNFLLRTYAIRHILNTVPFLTGLMATEGGVVLGMVYNYLPFMILPIYSSLTKLDTSLTEAASDLGASPAGVFRRVVLPLSVPGIVSGITMVFMPAISTFAISSMLGGGMVRMIGDRIEYLFQRGIYNFGSAISFVLMIIILLCMLIMNYFDSPKRSGGKNQRGGARNAA